MKKLLVITALVFLVLSTNLGAQCTTNVSGTIAGETWTKSGSPYCVSGDIRIASLTIDPGVRVEFLDDYEFKVAGILSAIGNDSDKIVFTREAGNENGWGGIHFDHTIQPCELKHCKIEGASSTGIYVDNSNPIIQYCEITNNHNINSNLGGGFYTNVSITLEDCLISNNSVQWNSEAAGGGIAIDVGFLISA